MADAHPTDALVPLSVFDKIYERSTFATGWIIAGTLDEQLISTALKSLTTKWRMLAARLESVKSETATSWLLRIPLQDIPPEYPTYTLTTSTSELPLSHFLELPLGIESPSLPHSLFVHASTPRHYAAWESSKSPITCWHITHFPEEDGKTYTCIGFARSHGIFDGVGAAAIMRGLVAEMNGKDWDVPPLPQPGLNENPITTAAEKERELAGRRGEEYGDAVGFTTFGITGLISGIGWHLKEKWWNKAQTKIIILPASGLDSLVSSVRSELALETKDDVRVSTGDILVAWLMQTIYSKGVSPQTAVFCSNLASFRSVLNVPSQWPHNAWVPLPLPLLTVEDLESLSLPGLARRLAQSRQSLDVFHVISAYQKLLQGVMILPGHDDADERFLVSNVSASRILETDWTAAGGRGTICSYRYSLTPLEILLTNSVYISGRLADGSVVFDVTLNKTRMESLVQETRRLAGLGSK
ncbi:hypothetical protein C8J56DRAFT_933797 [Mycena floridula]|nr:hypothetical protein C8J56DRAFT_933797 [Mycena floridula]